MSKSTWVKTGQPCPHCDGSDPAALNSRGWWTCYSCHKSWKDGHETEAEERDAATFIIGGECEHINARGIKADACRKYKYEQAYDDAGHPVQVANYYDPKTGKLTSQHIRGKDKKFSVRGGGVDYFWGQHLWAGDNKRVYITEGQIDALTVYQCMGSWPVVSLPGGASSVAKTFKSQQEWLQKQGEIVLVFDTDEPGIAARDEAIKLCPPGKVSTVMLPLKDANEMLLAGKGTELKQSLWSPKKHIPDGILDSVDVMPSMLTEKPMGESWGWDCLNGLSYGLRDGWTYVVGAAPGLGKSDLLCQSMVEYMRNGINVGGVFLEEGPDEILDTLVSKNAEQPLNRPDIGTREDRLEALEQYKQLPGKAYLYDAQFSDRTWESVKPIIYHMVRAQDCKLIILDNITVLIEGDNVDQFMHSLMKDITSAAKQLDVPIILVSHLRTPDGDKDHAEGAHVRQNQFYGSRAIAKYAYFMLGLERNTQDEDEEARNTLTIRCVKARKFGGQNGKIVRLFYDSDTGLLTDLNSQHSDANQEEDF